MLLAGLVYFALQLLAPFAAPPSASDSILGFFNDKNGAAPQAGVIAGEHGNLFGAASGGGPNSLGTVYEVVQDGSRWKLHVLHDFDTNGQDGLNPLAPLTLGRHGELYGTTLNGGTLCQAISCIGGTVYEMKRDTTGHWTESVLFSFTTANANGDALYGPVLEDSSGSLYGTAESGGRLGCGVIFRLDPTASGPWKYTQIYTFAGAPADGCFPTGPLTRDRNGALYGTTLEGGLSWYPLQQNGVVYRLSPPADGKGPWTESVLYEFEASKTNSDGRIPWSGVTLDPRGGLLGTTSEGGGSTNCGYGCGTAFRLVQTSKKPETWTEHVIHRFGAVGDGLRSYTGLTLGSGGALYSAAEAVGAGSSGTCCGLIYRLQPTKNPNRYTEQIVYNFKGGNNDGSAPLTEDLLLDNNVLYGTTFAGGPYCSSNPYGCGTVFAFNLK